VLPDVLIDDYEADLSRDNLAAMVKRFDASGASQVLVEPVPIEKVSSYGVVDTNGSELQAGHSAAMQAIVEKPPVNEAPSNLSVVGRYVLSSRIWDLLEKTPPGAGNEIQLTDTIGMLMDDEPVEAFHIQGRSHDCGNKQGYMQTFVTYGRRHPELGGAFSEFVAGLA